MSDTFYIDLDIQEFEHLKIYNYLTFEEIILNKQILTYIINNKMLFLKFLNILLDKSKYEIIIIVKNRKSKISLSKMTLFQALVNIIENDNIKLDKEIAIKLGQILRETTFENIIPSNEIHEVIIDNRVERIPIKTFLEFLNLEKNDFKLVLNLNIYKGYELNRFLYALMDFLKNSHYLDLYDFSEEIITRIKDLKEMKYVDFEYFNKHQKTIDINIDKIKINPKLECILDKEVEKDKDLFKKILNVYFKLCELFTYDEKYYVEPTIKHKQLSNIKRISLENNKVVCFEMAAILAYYLHKLGINYHAYPDDLKYGKIHPTIEFRYNEFLIRLDIVSSALMSDLVNVKVNESLRGITCINKNIATKLAFNNLLNRYYKPKFYDYEQVMLPANRFLYEDEFNTLIKDLLRYVDLAFKMVLEKELAPMDRMGYFLILLKKFKERYKLNNMNMQVIRDYNSKYGISMLISMEGNNDYAYVLYDFNNLEIFSQESMQKLFDNAVISGIVKKEIPGLRDNNIKVK